jgi:signal transduction histidine kinase
VLRVGTAGGPPLAGARPLQLVSRLLERDDSENARARAQTVADLLREAIHSVREEQAAMQSDRPR